MRRLCFVFGSVLLMGGLNLAFTQHSGGHGSGGRGSGGHAAGARMSHSASATSYSTLSNHYPTPGQVVYPTPIGLQQQYSGYTGINRGVLTNGRAGGRGLRGYGAGYGAGYLYPYYLSTYDDSPDSYYNNRSEDPAAQTAGVTANLLGEQIAQLSAEVDAMRNERQPAFEAPVERIPYRAPPAATDEPPAPQNPSIVLVLNNGKKLQVKNYAVMGQDIWDFSTQPTKRIAVSDVNVMASKAATEANGAEFPSL
jgi:hypothetical protein